jgi:EmrB/QacA subfamily drug resistance transporter
LQKEISPQSNTISSSYKWWVLAVISVANFLSALDMSIINITFPRLTEVFHTDASTIVWLNVAFAISELGLLLTMAKIGDTIGRKKVFVFGLALYTLGLLLCSISPNITILILSRVVQGAGAAVMMTLGSVIVVSAFPEKQQGQAIGIFSMLTAVGLIAGPAIGGVILDYLDWRGIFYSRIPIGLISLVLALLIIKEHKEFGSRLQLDISGAAVLLVGLSCLILYLNLGSGWGYLALPALALLAAAFALLGLFGFLERRAAQPVLELGLFRNRTFTLASVTNFLQMASCSILPVLIPFYMIGGLQMSSSTAGLLMSIIAVPPLLISPLAGWISDKIGNRIPMVLSTCLFTAAMFLASYLNIESGLLQVSLMLMIFGAGMGMFNAPNQSAVINSAPRRKMATALGVANTMRLLGAGIGSAFAGALYANQQEISRLELTAQGTAADLIGPLSIVHGFQYVIFLAAFVCASTIITSALSGQSKTADAEQ